MTEVATDNIVIEITSLSRSDPESDFDYGTESELDWEEACNQEAHRGAPWRQTERQM
jgi:hypothetical protein